METRTSQRRWAVVSFALIVVATAVIVITLIKDSPEQNSTSWYLLAVALGFGGIGAAALAQRQKSS